MPVNRWRKYRWSLSAGATASRNGPKYVCMDGWIQFRDDELVEGPHNHEGNNKCVAGSCAILWCACFVVGGLGLFSNSKIKKQHDRAPANLCIICSFHITRVDSLVQKYQPTVKRKEKKKQKRKRKKKGKQPHIWQDCRQGIYIDLGTNLGVQIRKLYDPQQFPGAPVLPYYNQTFGHNRSNVCSIGVEPNSNPSHTSYLH